MAEVGPRLTGAERAALRVEMQEEANALAQEWGVKQWEVQWSHQMRRARGRAYFGRWFIRISESIPREEIRRTFLHECAHMIAYAKYGDAGHGSAWRSVFIQLGGDGQTRYIGLRPATVAAMRLQG